MSQNPEMGLIVLQTGRSLAGNFKTMAKSGGAMTSQPLEPTCNCRKSICGSLFSESDTLLMIQPTAELHLTRAIEDSDHCFDLLCDQAAAPTLSRDEVVALETALPGPSCLAGIDICIRLKFFVRSSKNS